MKKGIFVEGITVEMLKNASLEAVEELISCGDIIDVELPLPEPKSTIYGYDVKHLALIATVLRKDNLTPDRAAEAIRDINRIAELLREEILENVKNTYCIAMAELDGGGEGDKKGMGRRGSSSRASRRRRYIHRRDRTGGGR